MRRWTEVWLDHRAPYQGDFAAYLTLLLIFNGMALLQDRPHFTWNRISRSTRADNTWRLHLGGCTEKPFSENSHRLLSPNCEKLHRQTSKWNATSSFNNHNHRNLCEGYECCTKRDLISHTKQMIMYIL